MIIVEGPDGAGKTQLVLRLADELQVPVEPKVVQPDMSSEVDLLRWSSDQIRGWPEKKIYDRFPLISEFIYGPIFKHNVRTPFKDFAELRILHDNFRAAQPVIIYCLPPVTEVLANVSRDDTDNSAVNSPAIHGVYWAYHNLAASSYGVVWDYTIPQSYELMLQHVKSQSYRRNYLEY